VTETYCKYCGSPCQADAPACSQCGHSQQSAVHGLSLGAQFLPENPPGIRCLRCDTIGPANAEFCHGCGARYGAVAGGFLTTTRCSQCGTLATSNTAYCAVCGFRLGYEYAGFWRRTGGYVIDALILLIPNALLNLAIPFVAGTILSVLYFGYFWTSSGQTLGMKAVGVRVQSLSGDPIGWGAAIGRYLMLAVSFLCLFIGVAWVGWQEHKRGWHDLAAGTEVIRVRR
jgi:uncharacterized RDD family membrane protein YckC